LAPRKLAADELDRIDSKNADLILTKGMKVGPMVRGQGFGKHPNDDTEEAGELGHRRRSFATVCVTIARRQRAALDTGES
jgi:hypothetical protein